jgi:hypothetical protein
LPTTAQNNTSVWNSAQNRQVFRAVDQHEHIRADLYALTLDLERRYVASFGSTRGAA